MSEGGRGSSVPDSAWAPPVPTAGGDGMGLAGYSDFVEIARGGDSVVYRARQNALDRFVAVKTVDVEGTSGGARFSRELEITLGLGRQHPHIVTVLDTGTTADGRAAIVMEYHELGSLHDRLTATGPLPVADVVKAASAVADALDFAHSRGILHRDVKPQNVLVLPTSYVLADFGIARMADAGHTASLERFSYRHASPQVLDGSPPTAADDIWSLGSTVFTLLDGRAPFATDDPADDTALAYLGRVRRGERRLLRRDDVPAVLAGLLDGCLAADPADRPPMAVLRQQLGVLSSEQFAWQPGAGGARKSADGRGVAGDSSMAPASAEPSAPAALATALPLAGDAAGSDPLPGDTSPDHTSPDQTSPDQTSLDHAAPEPLADGSSSQDPTADALAVPDATPEAATESGAATADVTPASPFAPPTAVVPSSVAAPAAPSTSAMAHIAPTATSARSAADAEPTGRTPHADADVTGGSGPGVAADGDAGEGFRSRRFRVIAVAVVALLLGLTIGIIAKVAGGNATPTSGPTTTRISAAPVPTVSTAPTGSVTSQAYDIGNPKLAPLDLRINDRGSALELTWKDQTGGKAQFLVVDVTGGRQNNVVQVAKGATSFTLEGVDPAATRVCVQVAALVFVDGVQDGGATPPLCAGRD